MQHASQLDIPQILEIKKQAHWYFAKCRPDIYTQSKILYTDNFLNDFFGNNNKHIEIAKLGEIVVGYAFVEIVDIKLPMLTNRKYVYIHDLAVLELYRNHGIAKNLLTQIENQSVDVGTTKIELAVHIFNDNAIRLYEQFGFKARTVRMEKQLNKEE